MTAEQIDEYAALYAAGALDGPELVAFQRLLAAGHTEALRALSLHERTAACLASGLSQPATPSSRLKENILAAIRRRNGADRRDSGTPSETLLSGFKYIANHATLDWQQARLPGAAIKVLYCNRPAGYAVVLGKLEAGVRYPAHDHVGSEELFVLTGDLHVGEYVLRAGDFHHADPGTHHQENFSVEGCTLLAVVHPSVLDDLGVTA